MRSGIRVADILEWDSFVTKYTQLNKIITRDTKITHDTKQELDLLKKYREELIKDKVIIDTA